MGFVQTFKFSELSDEAKEKVVSNLMEHGYSWDSEAIESLEALAEHFNGKLENYSIDFFNSSPSSAKFSMPEMDCETIQKKLNELGTFNPDTLKGYGDCKLTGVCFDENAIDGFRKEFMTKNETNLNKLMQAAFQEWLKICQEDCEYQFSNEAIQETCEANEYEFLKDGRMI